MRDGRESGFWKSVVVVIATLGLIGTAVAQQGQRAKRDARQANREGAGAPLKKPRPDAADPLAVGAGQMSKKATSGGFHYTFHFQSYDGAPLAASFYPAKLGSSAPVVMLVHEPGRSRKDFEDSVLDLKGQGLAEHLQGLGFAVFSFDLRGQGQNPRRSISGADRTLFIEDLQAAYFFLVDRHNRGDLNLTKLGVVALGSSSNMVAAWASQPGAAVTTDGRISDVSALVMVSPKPDGFGSILGHVVTTLTPRIPLFLQAGERDNPSKDAVQSVRARVERARLNKVEIYPSSLQGYKLLRLEPKAALAIVKFLEGTLKNRAVEWEPRYNLTPVSYGGIHVVANAKAPAATKAAIPAKAAVNPLPVPAKAAPPPAKAAPDPMPAPAAKDAPAAKAAPPDPKPALPKDAPPNPKPAAPGT